MRGKAMTRIAGFGFRRSAGAGSLADALARAGDAVDMLAALEGKTGPVADLAMQLGLPLHIVTRTDAANQTTLTDSAAAYAAYGLPSVAEAVALAAALAVAGPDARLAGPRVVSGDGMATAAIAVAVAGPAP